LELLPRQGAGEVGHVIVDDGAPDADGVELGICLRAGPLLCLQRPEVEVPDLVPMQLDPLVGEEMRGGPVDLLHAIVGQGPDQRAVDVADYPADVHAPPSALLDRAPGHGTRPRDSSQDAGAEPQRPASRSTTGARTGAWLSSMAK